MTESDLLACRQCLKARNIQKMTLFIIHYFQVHMVKKNCRTFHDIFCKNYVEA